MRDLLEKIDKLILTEWKKELDQLAFKTARSEPTLQDLKAAEKSATDDISSWTVNDAGMIGNLYGIMAEIYSQPFLFHADGSGRASLATRKKDFPDMYEVIADGSREKDAESVAKFQHGKGILHPKLEKKFGLTDKSKEKTSSDPEYKVDPGFLKHIKQKEKSDAGDRLQGQYAKIPDQKNKSVLQLGNVQKMTADDRNIGDLMAAYNNILKKYGTKLQESILKEEGPEHERLKNMMKGGGGTLNTPKAAKQVEADLAMLQAISGAVQRGFAAGTLSSTQKTNSYIMKMLNDTDRYTAMVKKDANYKDVVFDPTAEYTPELRPVKGPETAVLQLDPRLGDTHDNTELRRLARINAPSSKTQPKGTDSTASIQTAMQGPVKTQAKQFAANLLKLQKTDLEEFLTVVNYLKQEIPALGKPAKKAQGAVPGGLPGQTLNGEQQAAKQGGSGKRFDVLSGLKSGQPQFRGNKITQDAANDATGGSKTDSTDFNDLLKLAGTQKLTEASMNISMTGNTSSEVRELMDILKNAGMDDAMPVKDLDMFKSTDEPAPCPHCAAMHGMDSPCGEAVEEEWDNSPDEQYQDDEYMMHDLSGGINRKKERAAQRVKDPAVATESKFKSMLKTSLEEMYLKLSENDPFAELDRAIASDDMEGDLERQEKLARLKMKKKDRSRSDAAHDELSKEMGEASPNDLMMQMKRKTGTGMGGKQHSQSTKFANKTPMKIGPAKAPLSPDTHTMLKSVFPNHYTPERAKAMYYKLQQKTGDAMTWLRKKTGKI